jgi:hypothetical protein
VKKEGEKKPPAAASPAKKPQGEKKEVDRKTVVKKVLRCSV